MIGILNYLQSTRSEIAMEVHQCARFSNSPMLIHEKAVKRIAKYTSTTTDREIVFRPDKTKGL